MHYRIRGNNVQIVKTLRDEAANKSVSKPIGSVNLATGDFSDDAKENLTPEDRATVQAWLTQKQSIERRKRQLAAETFSETIGDLVRWTRESNVAKVSVLADDILFGLRDLHFAISAKLKEAA